MWPNPINQFAEYLDRSNSWDIDWAVMQSKLPFLSSIEYKYHGYRVKCADTLLVTKYKHLGSYFVHMYFSSGQSQLH